MHTLDFFYGFSLVGLLCLQSGDKYSSPLLFIVFCPFSRRIQCTADWWKPLRYLYLSIYFMQMDIDNCNSKTTKWHSSRIHIFAHTIFSLIHFLNIPLTAYMGTYSFTILLTKHLPVSSHMNTTYWHTPTLPTKTKATNSTIYIYIFLASPAAVLLTQLVLSFYLYICSTKSSLHIYT